MTRRVWRNTPKPCTEPPYSVGQDSANDLNANVKYPTLDGRIEDAKRSTATNKNSLYDSYVRAFRWATDRIGKTGVVGFVSNGGWIDGNTADGMRLSLADDYSAIYVYNLRGNQRTAGELSRREGGKVFGAGSRNTVALFIGVKDADHRGPCEVFYHDIGDYLSREDKLRIVNESQLDDMNWQTVTPNAHGDWINQRDDDYGSWPPIGEKKAPGVSTVFDTFSSGLKTGRDTWCYSFSRAVLDANISELVDQYRVVGSVFHLEFRGSKPSEQDVTTFLQTHPEFTTNDKISWNRSLKQYLAKNTSIKQIDDNVRLGSYRPFQRQWSYFDRRVNDMVYQLSAIFPTPHHRNNGILVLAPRDGTTFAALATDLLPDLSFFTYTVQFFPRWTYEKAESDDGGLDFAASSTDSTPDEYGYRRADNITDAILALYRGAIGDQVSKDDIFFYVYGLLHDPAYRVAYAADLKKMLPHIPTPETRDRFEQLANAGRKLADLHINYETVEAYPLEVQLRPGAKPEDRETWRVMKMKWAKRKDPTTGKNVDDHTILIYNGKVTVAGIPAAAERYMLGSRSALAWLIDRYQVKTDKASGIINDPNDWCDEHDDPTYIVELIKKVTTVAVETMKIVDSLSS